MDLSILFLKKSVLMIINDLFRTILELFFLEENFIRSCYFIITLHEFIDNNTDIEWDFLR